MHYITTPLLAVNCRSKTVLKMKPRVCLLLLTALLSCILVVSSQSTALTPLHITPCNGTLQKTVSLFENDILSVDWDPNACNDTHWEPNHFKGFRVFTFSEANSSNPVVFVAREADDGVVAWGIPLTPEDFSTEFSHVNRTVCPVLKKSDNSTSLVEAFSNQTLFYIDVFTSSSVNVPYSIFIETVPNFELSVGETYSILVGAASPQIYYFKVPDGVDAVTIKAVTDNPRCAMISVQNNTCPVNDLLQNAKSKGIYQTMSTSGFVTVRSMQVKDREFLLVLIVANYSSCHTSAPLIDLVPGNDTMDDINPHILHYEQMINVTIQELKPISKFAFAICLPVLVFVLLGIMALLVVACPIPTLLWTPVCKFSCGEKTGEHQGLLDSDREAASDQPKTTVNNLGDSSFSLSAVHEEDESKLKLTRMCKTKYKKLDRQYSVYGWNTVTVGIFYALPAFQLVLSEQQILNISGNQDICYYNFKCAHPFGVFSAFNNVWSNVGYVMLGVIFIAIVWIKNLMYRRKRNEDENYVDSHGVPQLFGVYYAMGIGLILEGFMSAFYHICPRDANFQFDTAFMFIIGGLLIVKIFQNRHPDVHANAFIAFFSFAVVIFFTLVGIYFDQVNPLAVRLTIFFFVLVMVVLFLISFYNFHQWSFKSMVKSVKNIKRRILCIPQHKIRFTKLMVAFIINLILAILVVAAWRYIDLATAVLSFFLVNVLYFLLMYIISKLFFKERWTLLPMCLLIVLTGVWAAAFYFFQGISVTDWRLTPAESRERNHECLLLGYYDSHDIWHFLSATALLVSFLFLFTLDDGMKDVKRTEIHIF